MKRNALRTTFFAILLTTLGCFAASDTPAGSTAGAAHLELVVSTQ